jgi:TolB-like protein
MSLFAELKRRSVFKIGAVYVVVAWLVIQAASIALPAFDAPAWVLRVFILVLLLGFPVALVLAWAFEMTPQGIKVDAHGVGAKRFAGVAIVLAALALFWFYRGQPSYKSDDVEAQSGPPSVAVLPFENLSGDPSQDYFSDGMTEELLNVLAQVKGLQVAARTSVFQYKGKGGDVREIGRKLGVQYLIEGSVRRDQQELRITAQMIRVADGFHVWSESWNRKLEGVFALQEDIARRIAEQLQGSISPDALPKARGNIDPDAYDEYLKGRELFRNRSDLLSAIAHLERAVAKAPDFAAAWASLSLADEAADWYLDPLTRSLTRDKAVKMAAAAERAQALAPDTALTLHALANVARAQAHFLDAERLYERSIAADPTYPDVREDYSELLVSVGRFEDSAAAARAGLEIDRNYGILWWRVALCADLLGRRDVFDDAATHLREVAPGLAKTTVDTTNYDFDHGDFATGLRQTEAAYARDPARYAWLLAMMRWSQHDPSIDEDAGRRETLALPGMTYFAGVRGDDALVFQSMTEPYVGWRYSLFTEIAFPSVQRYLVDPRATKLLRDNGFEAYWRAKGWPALCHPKGDHDFECGAAPGGTASQRPQTASGK